jgi:hypothetical protein
MKYGGPGGDGKLHWYISGRSGYSTPFNANVWHNGAYEIVRELPLDWRGRTLMLTSQNFSSREVSFWYSIGAAPLKRVTQPAKAGVSSVRPIFQSGLRKRF